MAAEPAKFSKAGRRGESSGWRHPREPAAHAQGGAAPHGRGLGGAAQRPAGGVPGSTAGSGDATHAGRLGGSTCADVGRRGECSRISGAGPLRARGWGAGPALWHGTIPWCTDDETMAMGTNALAPCHGTSRATCVRLGEAAAH